MPLSNMLKNTNCIGDLHEILMRNCLLIIQSLLMICQMVIGLICQRNFKEVSSRVINKFYMNSIFCKKTDCI